MLALVNAYRASAGVPPVAQDVALTKGCHEHAEYMRINRGKPQLYSTNAHHQDPSLPGATPEGAACGAAADLYPQIVDLESAVHGWMASLYHRRPILAPRVERVGIGWTRVIEPSEWSPGALVVALQFVWAPSSPPVTVVYPANGQFDVPLDFVREEPNPIPPPTIFAGYPITLQFPSGDTVSGVRATFVDGAGAPVPVWLSSPEAPASPYASNDGLVGLIPQQPLRASTRYTATISALWNGQPRTWTTTFTTMARIPVDAASDDAVFAARGKPVVLRGTIASASKITEGTVLLKLVTQGTRRLLAVEVEAPLPQTGVTVDKIYTLKGTKVEAEGTLKIDYGSARVTITPASPLRMVK